MAVAETALMTMLRAQHSTAERPGVHGDVREGNWENDGYTPAVSRPTS